MENRNGAAAGMVLVTCLVLCMAVLAGLGYLIGNMVLGLLIGIPVGMALGAYVVYKMYVIPLAQEMDSKDYSHLKTNWDDEEDNVE